MTNTTACGCKSYCELHGPEQRVCDFQLKNNEENQMNNVAEQLNWIHCLFQEIENSGYELPMGTYEIVYSILEDARDK